ncbi:MAG TPA: hypothetical protein PK971_05125, partial [Saprospiraceae bacterium]|nr:hypothetical protein [Saprospiraceae bacterium]
MMIEANECRVQTKETPFNPISLSRHLLLWKKATTSQLQPHRSSRTPPPHPQRKNLAQRFRVRKAGGFGP